MASRKSRLSNFPATTTGINENWTDYYLKKGYLSLESSSDSDFGIHFRLYANRIARQANKQLARLKKNNMTHFAYEAAVSFTERKYGTTRFKYSYSKNITPKDLYYQSLAVQRFLNYSTSTVEGYQEQINIRQAKMRQLLARAGYTNVEQEDLENFLYLLGEEDIRRTIRDATSLPKEEFGSQKLVEMIKGAYNPSTIDVVRDTFRLYRQSIEQTGNYSINDLMDDLQDIKEGKQEQVKERLLKMLNNMR